ncbi:MAG TPA: MFS transporter [Fimbriiglobus sp.]|nr:MFS transporter [Fimbriiglobus sp.]
MDPEPPSPPPAMTRAEWGLILVLVAIQFTHIVDFVIIMPLGERLMDELSLTEPQFGRIMTAYAWAAGLASLASSFVVDRFDRRAVLLTMYGGFAVSTLLCGLAPNYALLLASRTLAGAFGGVAAVTLMTIIGDVFPSAKRGRATGAVMSAFAVASVVGLPIGLALAGTFGRGAPFLALAGLSALVWAVGWLRVPPVRGHLGAPRSGRLAEFAAVVREPNHLRAFAFTFFLVIGTFTVGSFAAPYLCSWNGWGEWELLVIYFVSGLCTLVAMSYTGRLTDRLPRRPLYVGLAAVALTLAVVTSHLPPGPLWVATVVLTLFTVFASARSVPAQAILLGAAAPRVRGAFLSVNTAVQHLGVGVAPLVAGSLTGRDAAGHLTGFGLVGLVSAGTGAVSLVLVWLVRPAAEDAATVVEPQHTATEREPEPKPTAV